MKGMKKSYLFFKSSIIGKKQKRHKLEDVFTPSSAAMLTFVDRPELDRQINKAILIPGMQLILYGHSGSGKTTLIQNTLKSKSLNFISSNCMVDTTVDGLILEAFDKLEPFYTCEKTSKTINRISSELKASYVTFDTVIKGEKSQENDKKKQRALPIQLTPQRLAEFLGASQIIWIIEDFHKVKEQERKKFSQILKIFVDMSIKYKTVKVVAIGAVGTAREVVCYDNELTNRVSEIEVPLMKKSELDSIIKKGESLLNICFSINTRNDIIKSSNSLAAICHQLCFSICFNNNINETLKTKVNLDETTLHNAVIDYLKQNSDSFKKILDRALKPRDGGFDDTKSILQAFTGEKEELTHKEILAYKSNRKLYGKNIKSFLNLLTTAEYGEILRYDDNSGKYSFSNPFFKAYTIMKFSTEAKERHENDYVKFEEILKLLNFSLTKLKVTENVMVNNSSQKKERIKKKKRKKRF